MSYRHTDGGRKAAGYRGATGDCACRAIAIATGKTYRETYELINHFAADEMYVRGRVGMRAAIGKGSSARTGVLMRTMKVIMDNLDCPWTPTMGIGTGCRVHVRADELPKGRLVLRLSGHYAAFIDGVLHDTYDSSRDGTRCVYGYWYCGEPRA